jgi:putative flavoprotein involved in K+ transport
MGRILFQFSKLGLMLPGYKNEGNDLHSFAKGHQVVQFLERYASSIRAPLRSEAEVVSLSQHSNSNRYLLDVGGPMIEASNVVVATGPFQRPAIPRANIEVPDGIFQVLSNGYRNPDQLPHGAVLVVGGGSSGCQIADDLLEAGRKVYLSVGQHRRVPRRYRGQDYAWWRWKTGAWDRRADSLPSPRDKYTPAPLLTGVNGGYDVDFRHMSSKGIVLLGHLSAIAGGRIAFAPDLQQNLLNGDKWFTDFKRSVDDYIEKAAMSCDRDISSKNQVPEPEDVTNPILELDLKANGITSIIWSSGFRYDFDWIKLPILDETGEPVHERGVTQMPGISFLGLQWLYKLQSAFLSLGGPEEDAAYLADRISHRQSTNG